MLEECAQQCRRRVGLDAADDLGAVRQSPIAQQVVHGAGRSRLVVPSAEDHATDPRLQDLANTLLDRPDDTAGIDEWAQRLNMSSRTLMRRFRQETGVTLGQWRQQARLLRALELLCRGGSVTEASLSVGYESTSAFIGSFRAAFGVTPTRYLAERE